MLHTCLAILLSTVIPFVLLSIYQHRKSVRQVQRLELEIMERVSGDFMHQQLINECLLPQLIELNSLQNMVYGLEEHLPARQLMLNNISSLKAGVKKTETLIRSASSRLYPPYLTQYFTEVCQRRLMQVEESQQDKGVSISFIHTGSFDDLKGKKYLLYSIYTLIDLFVTNSIKHAESAHIHVELIRDKQVITLKMSDDGKGFDLKARLNQVDFQSRGLSDFTERAKALSPDFTFYSEPGQGTNFSIYIQIRHV